MGDDIETDVREIGVGRGLDCPCRGYVPMTGVSVRNVQPSSCADPLIVILLLVKGEFLGLMWTGIAQSV